MKLLFVCENYLPHYGGAEVVFKNLAERYVKKNHQVSLVTHQLKGTKKNEVIGGIQVYRIPSFFSRYIFTFAAIPKTIKLARKHDLIQTTTFNGAFPAWIAGKITKKPVVITVHEVWVGKWKQVTGFSWFKSWIHEFLERVIYLLPFDKYICVSNATRKDLLSLGIKKEKTETIYNGMDYHLWNQNNFKNKEVKKIKEKLGLKNKFVYFSWGRPGVSKGFEYIIKASSLIKKRIPNSLFLLMLGSSDKYKKKYKELMNLIKKNNLKDYIKVINSVPYRQLGNYIKAADCIVVPSIAEGFGYTTVEAVSMNKPVVISDAGSLPEVVSGRYQIFKNKNIIDLANKVTKISKKDYLQKKVKKFEWEESINKYLKTCSALLNKRR